MRLNLTNVGSSCGDNSDAPLPLGVDNNEELLLDPSVEPKAIFAVIETDIDFPEGFTILERLGSEAEVEATVLEGLLAFVFIPLKLQT